MAANTSFADFVKEGRERKKNEALAQQFLGSKARKAASASGAGALSNARATANSQKPSLLSRISGGAGVQKPRSSSAKPASTAGSIDGKWQHDLHRLNNPNGAAAKRITRTASASLIDRNTRTFDKFASVVGRSNGAVDSSPGLNIRGAATGAAAGYRVVGSNFAPGTTAADIEAVVGPHGGDLLDCKVVTASPTVMVEMVFATKEGAENVIATFNNKKADGRLLYVYMKNPVGAAPVRAPPRALQHSYDDMNLDTNGSPRNGSYQDGRYGFNEDRLAGVPRGPRRRF